jgi:hypothetical protein
MLGHGDLKETTLYPEKARAAYRDFLTLWSSADPDLPILKRAKTEYARLNLDNQGD